MESRPEDGSVGGRPAHAGHIPPMSWDFLDDEDDDGKPCWIDEALARGEGFKSEEERQAYIKSLGDPERHPMFCRNPEDLDPKYAEAFRQLQEEDKSLVELCNMYKNEGNEFMKSTPQVLLKAEKEGTMSKNGRVESAAQRGKKNMDEAYDRYAYALVFLDRADKARASRLAREEEKAKTAAGGGCGDGNKEEGAVSSVAIGGGENSANGKIEEDDENVKDREVDLVLLRSQILANRGLASLNLNNFGYCRDDCVSSLKLCSTNVKAHYRLCKALEGMRKFDKCVTACNLALTVDPSNADILKIRQTSQATLDNISRQVESRRAELKDKAAGWASVYRALVKGGIVVGYPEVAALPQQFREVPYPHLLLLDKIGNEITSYNIAANTNISELYYPILFLYPQYSQIDVLHHAYGDSLLAEQMAQMFPEEERVAWDRDKEYRCSELVVYLVLQCSRQVESEQDWVGCCTEVALLNGMLVEKDLQLMGYEGKSSLDNTQIIGNRNDSSSTGGSDASDQVRNQTITSLLRQKFEKRTAAFHAWRNSRDTSSVFLPSSAAAGDKKKANNTNTTTTADINIQAKTVVEIPLGLSISSIYQIPGAVLPGGITTLLVFPKSKSNGAHKKFIDDQERLGFVFRKIDGFGRLV